MHLIEMRKGVRQLSENDFCAAAVHQVHVVSFKCVHEAFSNAIRLRTAYRRVYWLDAQFARQRVRFMSEVSATVIAQKLQLRRSNIRLAKSCFDSFN